ncbi:MAG: PEP-CTERM sorting domain-containing protein [Bryobacteraceae bacterium]
MSKGAAIRGLLCLLSVTMALQATSITLGSPALSGTGNCDPFGCPQFFGLSTYQQVYLSSAFPGAIDVSQIAFFDTQIHNGGVTAGGTYTVSFSYTGMTPGNLSTTNASFNVGSSIGTFFSGSLPGTVPITGGKMLTFDGSTFLYDPSLGNLLMTVSVVNPSDVGPPFLFLDQSQSSLVTSNVYFGTWKGTPISGQNAGLITQFTYSAVGNSVPEPGSIFLTAAGIALAGLTGLRRKFAR